MSDKNVKSQKNSENFESAAKLFAEFCATVAQLRDPVTGCPWDLAQDHATLRRYMIEEAYEAAHVMATADSEPEASVALCDELGDVLLQVVLNAQVASDRNCFEIKDVIQAINAKMRRRHPHVFGSDVERAERDIEDIKKKWGEIKAAEKKEAISSPEGNEGFFSDLHGYPATIEALEIGKRAAKINFDWKTPAEVLAKLLSEVEEVKEEWESGDRSALISELGDVYFSLAQLSRHLGLDPEVVALDGNRKFKRRFEVVERLAHQQGLDIESASQATLESLWEQAKKENPR